MMLPAKQPLNNGKKNKNDDDIMTNISVKIK